MRSRLAVEPEQRVPGLAGDERAGHEPAPLLDARRAYLHPAAATRMARAQYQVHAVIGRDVRPEGGIDPRDEIAERQPARAFAQVDRDERRTVDRYLQVVPG